MRVPLFVSASAIFTVIAIVLAVALRTLSATYQRRYVDEWQRSWTALAVYAFAAGTAMMAAGYPDLLEFRRVFSVLSIAAAWWHLRHLLKGMRDVCESTVALPAWREWTLGGLMLTSAVLALLPLTPQPEAALQAYLLRMMLLAVA